MEAKTLQSEALDRLERATAELEATYKLQESLLSYMRDAALSAFRAGFAAATEGKKEKYNTAMDKIDSAINDAMDELSVWAQKPGV
jgi:phage gpG-like protein